MYIVVGSAPHPYTLCKMFVHYIELCLIQHCVYKLWSVHIAYVAI